MGGHLWKVYTIKGTYKMVIRSTNEEQAREMFRRVLGSSEQIEDIELCDFVHVVQE